MAVTYEDLATRRRRNDDMLGKLAHYLIALSLLCGAVAFVLCLAAEANKSELVAGYGGGNGGGIVTGELGSCSYTGSGKAALLCAAFAFVVLAAAMFLEHAYMLVAVASPRPPDLAPWGAPADDPRSSSSGRSAAHKACFLFLATWVCFAVAEVLLLIGIGVESGHLSDWRRPRDGGGCVVVRQGVFAAAGVLGLLTSALGLAVYRTALWAQKLHREEKDMHDHDRYYYHGRQQPPLPPHAAAPRFPPPPTAPPTNVHPRLEGLEPPHHEITSASM